MSEIPSYKVTFVGPTNVGKTSVLKRLDKNVFSETETAPTTSMQCHPHTFTSLKGIVINVNFWDTAGQEEYKSLGPMYYRNSAYCIAVFDVTNKDTFTLLLDYIQMFKENNNVTNAQIAVVGNKMDLLDDHTATNSYLNWAVENGYSLYLTSAKTGEGIADLVHELVEALVPSVEKAEEQDLDIKITITEAPKQSKKGCC